MKKCDSMKIFSWVLCLFGLVSIIGCNPNVVEINKPSNKNLAAISIGGTERTIGSSVSSINDFTELRLAYKETGSASSEETLSTWQTKAGLSAYEIACSDVIYIPAGVYDFTLYGIKGNFTYKGVQKNKTIVISEDKAINHLDFAMEQFNFVAGSGNGRFSVTLTVPSEVSYAMASLLNSSGAEIVGYTAEKIDAIDSKIVYAKDNVPSGPYKVNFVLYSETGVMLGFYREIVNIAAGDLSAGSRTIASVNDLYSIAYQQNGGIFASTAPENYSRLSPVTSMPVINKGMFRFMGWYNTESFSGTPVSSLVTGDITLYAKFRIAATINGSTREWSESDKVAIYAKLEGDLEKTWSELTVASKASATVAELDGLKGIQTEYNAFMPASKHGTSVDYTGQVVTSNGSTSHLEAYNYLVGYSNTSGVLTMNSVGSKVKLNFTSVPTGKQFTKVVLYAPNYKFLTKGTVDFKSATLTETASDIHFEIGLNNITATGGNLSVYAMVPPVDVATYGGAGNKIIVTLIDSSNNYYIGRIENTASTGVKITKGTETEYSVAIETLPHFVTVNGVKVATHNVGAYSPEEEGKFYTFNEAKTALNNDPVFGTGYRLMSYDDVVKLTDTTMTQINTWVHGVKYGSGSDSVIFSARGYYDGANFSNDNVDGNIWLSDTCDTTDAFAMYVIKDGAGITTWARTQKFNVRPVKN